MKTTKKYDFFISYSHKDQAVADELHAEITRRGYTCFIDSSCIQAGEDWMDAIAEAILSSERFVFLGSQNYYTSKNTRRELNYATQHLDDKAIYPYLIDDKEMSHGTQMAIGLIHWRRYSEAGVKQFVSEIAGPEPENTGETGNKNPEKKKQTPRARYTLFARIIMSSTIVLSLLITATGLYYWQTKSGNVAGFAAHIAISFGFIGLGTAMVYHLRRLWPSIFAMAGIGWIARTIWLYYKTVGGTLLGMEKAGDIVRADLTLAFVVMVFTTILIAAIAQSWDVFRQKQKPYFPAWMWAIYRRIRNRH